MKFLAHRTLIMSKAIFPAALAFVFVALAVGCGGRTGAVQVASRGLDTGSADVHTRFTEILRDYVQAGRVDYGRLCEDGRLQEYIGRLAATDPDAIADDKARLAFWINAYNAYTLKVICDHYPVESINELHFGGMIIGTVLNKTVWDKKFVVVDGERMSLNHIEHDIVRPVFADPRAHFGLVCASRSCPPLRDEAFEGNRMDAQLDEQARIFFADEEKNRFDVENEIAYLSKILDWYGDDFGKDDEEILRYVARFLPDTLAHAVRANPGRWDIRHTEYDWSLNE